MEHVKKLLEQLHAAAVKLSPEEMREVGDDLEDEADTLREYADDAEAEAVEDEDEEDE